MNFDAWEQLGSPGWGHKGLQRYLKKSTHFDGPSVAVRQNFNITYDATAYVAGGYCLMQYPVSFIIRYGDGPVKVSIPSYQYEDYTNVMGSFVARADIPQEIEGFSRSIGTFWTLNTINNNTKERSHARKAYYDPVKERPNLHLLTNIHVDALVFRDDKRLAVSGVKLTSNADFTTTSVYAAKEVILAAGAILTPHLLMISGIGPKDILSTANIKVKKDLPAVGSNLQGHQALYMRFRFKLSDQTTPNQDMLVTAPIDQAFKASAKELYTANRNGPWTFGRGNAALFLALQDFSKKYKDTTAALSKQDATMYLPTRYSTNKNLMKGYLAQRKILVQHYLCKDTVTGVR